MIALILTALLAAGSPALAQDPRGVKSEWSDAQLSQTETRRLVAHFANCVAQRQPGKATAFVLDPRPAERNLSLFDGACLGRSFVQLRLKLHHEAMAYALADELIQREKLASAARVVDAGPIHHREFVVLPTPAEIANDPVRRWEWQAAGNRAHGYSILSRFGECVVRTAPSQSAALISTRVSSKNEQAAFEALAPALTQCVEKGGKLTLNKFTARGTVALNLYRLAHAPRVAEAAK